MRKGKQSIPRHRGRRGSHYGDPANGRPGTRLSRATLARMERALEKRTRQEGQRDILEQLP